MKNAARRVKRILRRVLNPLGPVRIIVQRIKLTIRFIVHPNDFLALYNNEALVTDAAVAYSVQRIENELHDSVQALRKELDDLRAQLEARG
jgi:hypothetical protein